jgi:hypothetical protein
MLITRSNNWEDGSRKYTVNREFRLGPFSLKFATIALITIIALFYLAQTTQGAAQKYQIMQLSSTKNELQAKSQELEVEAARFKSLNEIEKSAQGFEPIQQSNLSLNSAN